jgi:hypothetical protein
LAAILSGRPARTAISIARSGRFSGEMRQEGEVGLRRPRIERQHAGRDAVMDPADPVHRRHRQALVVGDRDQRDLRERLVEGQQVGHVEPSVQGRHGPVGDSADRGERQQVDVEVKHVEFGGPTQHLVQHHDVIGQVILDPGIEPQGHVGAGDQPGGGTGITAGKQSDVVSLAHQLLGEVRDDTLGPAVKLRRYAFGERRYLCNFHVNESNAGRMASFPAC